MAVESRFFNSDQVIFLVFTETGFSIERRTARYGMSLSYSACEPIQNQIIVAPSTRQCPMTEADSDRIQSFNWVDLFEAEARMIRILQEQPEGPTGSHLNITWQQRESASEPGCDVRSQSLSGSSTWVRPARS